jgi:uncharacterized circularly permuted ATP-grasp superfamily protein
MGIEAKRETVTTTSYDELVTGTGAFRPHWRALMETWLALDPDQLSERLARVSAQIAAADQILALPDPSAAATSRSLDLLPLILPEAEWRGIAAGLVQRAWLLDRILADLYGPQRLVAEHKLPPYLALGSPAFLRPLRFITPAAGAPHLHFYAADLVRLANGEWRVFADRTQASAGVGYALHNRSVLARTFPEAFRALGVSPLDSFVELWRSSLRAIGDRLGPAPLIVLYTPGPYNDAYFEHVFLARELGITLVQNDDLTVRDNHVYLKTLDGLARVDVIYRRVDGDYCDSLELREDSALGVAGLVEVARAGHVAILNMPGSALVGAPALAPFLPELCRTLLGEELALPAVTTWWCGQESALAEVRAALDGFAVHSAFEPDPVPIDPALLSRDDRADFEAQLLRHPERFVAREKMSPSVAPCFGIEDAQQGGARLVPKPVVVRVMALWHEGNWFALPGGVARIVSGPSIYRSTLRHGAVSKDVWVLPGEPQAGAAPRAPSVKSTRTERWALRSRTADDLFWLGRHVERLESGARQFLATLQRLTSGTMTPRHRAELVRLAEALRRTGWINAGLAASPVDGIAFFEGVAEAASDGVTMRNSIDAINRLMHAARDQLSLDMWHTLRRLTLAASARFGANLREPDELLEALDGMNASLAAFGGLIAENMQRGAGWRFLDLGRRIERGIGICQALGGVMSGRPEQVEAGLRLTLDLTDSTSGYLLRFPLEGHFAHAVNFVLTDRGNPRALLYQLDHIERHLGVEASHSGISPETSAIPALIEAVEVSSFDFADGEAARPLLDDLHLLLERGAGDLMTLSTAVTRAYFTHTAAQHLMRFASRQLPAPVAP